MRFDGDSLCPPIRDALGVVVTERLFLRPLQEGDTDRLAPIFAKEEVWRYPFGRRLTRHETVAFVDGQLAHWVRYGFGLWLVEERLSGRAIGYLGLSVPTFLPAVLPAVEVGWRLDPSAWGRGYATEGGAAALAQAFGTLGLERVVSLTQTDNAASCRVAERIGMTVDHAVIAPATEKRGPVQVAVYEIAAGQLRT